MPALWDCENLGHSHRARPEERPLQGRSRGAARLTSAVPEVGLVGRVVLAQPLQDLLVVHEPVQRAQQEGVERQVAHLLQLEVSAQVLQPPGAPDARLQRLQGLAVLPQVHSQLLLGPKDKGGEGSRSAELHVPAVRPPTGLRQ